MANVVFEVCKHCGEEYFTESVHLMTCSVLNPDLAKDVKAELDKPGGIDMEDVAGGKFTITDLTGAGEDAEYPCSFCEATVKQDADMDILTDLKGNAVCSHLCQTAANDRIQAEANYDLEIKDAIAAYVELDRLEHAHKQFYKDRAAAFARIEALIGVGGHFSDDAGIVYEIAPKKGQWVDFTPYEMHRTRRDTDASGKGSMTLDRAEELGYEVERKKAKPKAKTAPDDPAPGKAGEEV